MVKKDLKKILPHVVYFLFALFGGLVIFYGMKWGPWAYSDSSAYVSAARNFLSGKGLSIIQSSGDITAVTEFPPFYPIFLSFFLRGNVDIIFLIRFINVILFIISIFTFSQILYSASQNHILSLIGTLLFSSFRLIISTFSSAMSEPLFLSLLLISLYIVQIYIHRQNRIHLILFIFISSLLPIIRYAGILFVSMYGVCLFISLDQVPIVERLKIIFSYYFFSFLPIGIWGYSLFRRFNQFGGKNFNIDFSIFSRVFNGLVKQFNVIKLWIPYVEINQNTTIEIIILVATIFIILFLLIFMAYKFIEDDSFRKKRQKILFIFSISLIVGYLLFIGITHSITIPQIDIIDRMLVPVYPLSILVLAISINTLFSSKSYKLYIYSFLAIICFFILRFNFLFSNSFIHRMHEDGLGFTSRIYQQSGIIDAVKGLPQGQKLISNSAGFVLFYDNRYPIQINDFPDNVFGKGNSYGEKIFREEETSLIILFSDFSNYYNDHAGKFIDEITKTLTIKYSDDEGGIYSYPKY